MIDKTMQQVLVWFLLVVLGVFTAWASIAVMTRYWGPLSGTKERPCATAHDEWHDGAARKICDAYR